MKRVVIFLISVVCLAVLSFIFLELLGFYDITIILTPSMEPWISALSLIGISIGVPITVQILIIVIRFIHGLFKPKFIRIADQLERTINRKQNISHKLDISQKREHVIAKLEHIWMKADMQYPLSDLDFEKLGGSPSA